MELGAISTAPRSGLHPSRRGSSLRTQAFHAGREAAAGGVDRLHTFFGTQPPPPAAAAAPVQGPLLADALQLYLPQCAASKPAAPASVPPAVLQQQAVAVGWSPARPSGRQGRRHLRQHNWEAGPGSDAVAAAAAAGSSESVPSPDQAVQQQQFDYSPAAAVEALGQLTEQQLRQLQQALLQLSHQGSERVQQLAAAGQQLTAARQKQVASVATAGQQLTAAGQQQAVSLRDAALAVPAAHMLAVEARLAGASGAAQQQLGALRQLGSEQLLHLQQAAAHAQQSLRGFKLPQALQQLEWRQGRQLQQAPSAAAAGGKVVARNQQKAPASKMQAQPTQQQKPQQQQGGGRGRAGQVASQAQAPADSWQQAAVQQLAHLRSLTSAQLESLRQAAEHARLALQQRLPSGGLPPLPEVQRSVAGSAGQAAQQVHVAVQGLQQRLPDGPAVRAAAAEWWWVLLLAAAAVALAVLRGLRSLGANHAQQEIRDAEQRARGAKLKERQRQRFQRALVAAEDFEAISVDSSAFAAVSKKGGAAGSRPAGGAAGGGVGAASSSGGSSNPFLSSMGVAAFDMQADPPAGVEGSVGAFDDESESDDVFDAEAWDADTKRAWDEFVKTSRVGQGKMWDTSQVDEGLPQVWVDLNKE